MHYNILPLIVHYNILPLLVHYNILPLIVHYNLLLIVHYNILPLMVHASSKENDNTDDHSHFWNEDPNMPGIDFELELA